MTRELTDKEYEAGIEEVAELRAEIERLQTEKVAIISAVVQTIGGTVENHPTSSINYLQRLRAMRVALESKPKTFTMFRRNVPDATHDANQKTAPDDPQFEGVRFSDGSVAIRWLTAKRSTAVWASMEDMLAIHGHPEYGSELVWWEPKP